MISARTGLLFSGSFSNPWALLFALGHDFDDEHWEDRDDPDPKRPTRRPLVLMLLLLVVVVSVGYFVMDPKSSVIRTPNTVLTTGQFQVPLFQEGQFVVVRAESPSLNLLALADETQERPSGPLIQSGELLTIVDGMVIKDDWIYLVHTTSGASGWIYERHLHERHL